MSEPILPVPPPVPFEKRRFRSAAAHYRTGRPAYAALLFARVAERIGLAQRHAVLDLGCGPGPLAIGFAPFAGSVTAIDPEPEMLRSAAAAAADCGMVIRFIEASSYDIGPAFGRFRLVTIGRAFHWMDREETLRRLDQMIEPGGAVALFRDRHLVVPDNAWHDAFDAVLEKFGGDDPVRTERKSPNRPKHEAVLLDSPFCRLERIGVVERRHTPSAHFIDRMLSFSSTSPQMIEGRVEAMVAELEAALAPYAENGIIAEVVESEALIAMRPGA
ncbi:MAG TPA: class I SAM-dependent methyltransferase [Candidatus Cybelea sp.]|nr:class I SAM-dependent methyltransferase [Candidatus Cybelea sp.]